MEDTLSKKEKKKEMKGSLGTGLFSMLFIYCILGCCCNVMFLSLMFSLFKVNSEQGLLSVLASTKY